jgi:hypothetical protein
MPRFIMSIAVLAIVATGCGQAAGAAPATSPVPSAPAARLARPTFQLEVTGGTAAGSYAADPAASLASCGLSSTGVRTVMYAGGDP